MEYRKTHLINEHGDRQVVETRNADIEIRRLNKSTNSRCHIDQNWCEQDGAKADAADIIIRVMRDRDKQNITKI